MAEYRENQIILSEEESNAFRQRIERPDKEPIKRRDQTLEWIAQHMRMQETRTGFSVEVLDY